MSEEEQYQKSAGKDEKHEKQEEKEGTSWEEKWRRDPLSAAVWALILIWAGVVLLANNLGLLDWVPFFDAWALGFLGAGVILLLEAGFRMIVPAYRQPVSVNLIVGIIFVAIALGNVFDWACILPLTVIALGFYLLFSGLLRRRE